MANALPSRTLVKPALAAVFAAFLTTTARADAPVCSASGDFECRLRSVLSFLDIAVAILAVVLIIVAALAIRYYRSSAREDDRSRKPHRTRRT